VVTPASQSYITQLWNNEIFHNRKNTEKSFIHPWSRYFTYALFTIAAAAALYWSRQDPARVWPVMTSVLIVACPCSLLLSATFTYGNMVRIFGRNRLYLKNAGVIESLSKINAIVFDKTGTLTQHQGSGIRYEGEALHESELAMIRSVSRQSAHPLSRMIARSLEKDMADSLAVTDYREYTGQGVEALADASLVRLGSAGFVKSTQEPSLPPGENGSHIYVSIDGHLKGNFTISNQYRACVREMAAMLREDHYALHLLSGDNDMEQKNLAGIFGSNTPMAFRQSPEDKLAYVKSLQENGQRVLMMGDGLNDAGALRQSEVGIAVSDNTNLFTPASDAILDGSNLRLFAGLLRFARSGKTIVTLSFILSILYNIIGLSYATQGLLSPLVAAILMPASSISIVIFVSLASNWSARRKGLET
jgi:P-type Cu+ transporter